MQIQCYEPFGNFVPGDVVDVPNSNYDTAYFQPAGQADEPPKTTTRKQDKDAAGGE